MTLNSQTLNLNARQILIKRLTNVQAAAYTGPLGELVLDTTQRVLRIQDGVNPGGIVIVSANVDNLLNQVTSLNNNGYAAELTATGNLQISGHLLPNVSLAQDLGSPNQQWRSLYVGANTIYLGNAAISLGANGLQITSSTGTALPLVGNIRFPDGTQQTTAATSAVISSIANSAVAIERIRAQDIEANLQGQIDFIRSNFNSSAVDSLTELLSLLQNNDQAVQGNLIAALANETAARQAGDAQLLSIINTLGSNVSANIGNISTGGNTVVAANTTKTWTNTLTSNVWSIVEYSSGIRTTNIDRRINYVETFQTPYLANSLPEFNSVLGAIDVVKVPKTTKPDLDVMVKAYELGTMAQANVQVGSTSSDILTVTEEGANYVLTLMQSINPYAANANVTVTYTTTNQGVPAVWFDPTASTTGNANFHGATIDYHALLEGSGTMIGTIKIAVNDNLTHVSHSETTSGDTSVGTTILWGRFEDKEHCLYYYRSDGLASPISIQWTAKLFYADYGA